MGNGTSQKVVSEVERGQVHRAAKLDSYLSAEIVPFEQEKQVGPWDGHWAPQERDVPQAGCCQGQGVVMVQHLLSTVTAFRSGCSTPSESQETTVSSTRNMHSSDLNPARKCYNASLPQKAVTKLTRFGTAGPIRDWDSLNAIKMFARIHIKLTLETRLVTWWFFIIVIVTVRSISDSLQLDDID